MADGAIWMAGDVTDSVLAATSVCVIIPTFRRPKGLACAMASVKAQAYVNLSLIVCDNSPEASARIQVMEFGDAAPFPVIFIHEPKTGVANARNSAVAACKADFVAFLDDDEEAPSNWLNRLMTAQVEFHADVVFGPVVARLPEPDVIYDGYLERFFSRFGPKTSQRLNSYYGCGNSLIRRASFPASTPFSVAHNDMGGEDDQLFNSLMVSGATFAWAADASVFEDVPLARAQLSYALKRAFAYGQGPSYTAAKMGKPITMLAWMTQGLMQGAIFGIWGLGLLALKNPNSARRLDKAARGFGKVLWFPPFKIGFYGTALLKAKSAAR